MDPILSWARLSQRLFNRPLLAEPQAACIVLQALSSRLGVTSIRMDGEPVDMTMLAANGQETIREAREYSVQNGVATVPIQGELVGRSIRLQPMSGLTGYSAIGNALDMAVSDQDVRGILLDIDSPGGEIGARDLADRIKSLDTEKPIWALIDDYGASAAYYIASAADRIIIPQEGAAGSIGAIALIPDTKNALEASGITVHVIRSAEMKGKPLSVEGIDAAGLDTVRSIIDKLGEDFVKTVAAYRGISQKSVRETKGNIVFGRDMLSTRLADEIMPAHEARQQFAEYVNRGSAPKRRQSGTAQMAAQTGQAAARLVYNQQTGEAREITVRPGSIVQMAAEEVFIPAGMTIEQFKAAISAAGTIEPATTEPEPVVVVRQTAPATIQPRQDVEAERLRIGQIVCLPEAKGREVAALHLALAAPELTAERAKPILAAMGQQQAAPAAAATKTPWQEMMETMGNVVVGDAGGAAGGGTDKVSEAAAGIISFVPPDQLRRKA